MTCRRMGKNVKRVIADKDQLRLSYTPSRSYTVRKYQDSSQLPLNSHPQLC